MNDLARIEAESHALAQAAGYALSTWTIIETNLTKLFQIISELPDGNKAHLIMEAIISFDARLKVVSNIMDVFPWADEEREIWGLLVNRIQKQQKRRNQLAHFMIINVSDGAVTNARLSPFYSQGAAFRNELTLLAVTDIEERSRRFRDLANAVNWFGAAAMQLKNKPEAALRPDNDPIRDIRNSIAQSRADKARQHQA